MCSPYSGDFCDIKLSSPLHSGTNLTSCLVDNHIHNLSGDIFPLGELFSGYTPPFISNIEDKFALSGRSRFLYWTEVSYEGRYDL